MRESNRHQAASKSNVVGKFYHSSMTEVENNENATSPETQFIPLVLAISVTAPCHIHIPQDVTNAISCGVLALRPHRRLPRHAPAAMHAPSVNIGSCALWAGEACRAQARGSQAHRAQARGEGSTTLVPEFTAQKPKTLQNRTLCERTRWPAKVGISPPWKLKTKTPPK